MLLVGHRVDQSVPHSLQHIETELNFHKFVLFKLDQHQPFGKLMNFLRRNLISFVRGFSIRSLLEESRILEGDCLKGNFEQILLVRIQV